MRSYVTFCALALLATLLAASTAPRAQAQGQLPPTGSINVIFTEEGSGGGLPIIVGDGAGFVEYVNPEQNPCPDPGDPGCALGLGNTVYNDPNVTDDYYVSSTLTGDVIRLYRYLETGAGDHYAYRWTAAGGYGLEFGAPGTFGSPGTSGATVIRVPFEIWAVGPDLGDTSDDVQMIPLLLLDVGADNTAGTADDDSTLVADWFTENPFVGFAEDGSGFRATNAIYMMMPDRANGYDLFEAAALASGGAGSDFVDPDDTVTPIDPAHLDVGDVSPASGEDCAHQGGFIAWCYRNNQLTGTPQAPNIYGSYFGAGDPLLDPNLLFVYPIGRVQFIEDASVVAVEPSDPGQPEGHAVLPVQPNPFRDRAVVPYTLAAAGHVRLAVYDVLGREVAVLVDAEQAAGRHEAAFDATRLPAGLYVARLEVAGAAVSLQKMVLQR